MPLVLRVTSTRMLGILILRFNRSEKSCLAQLLRYRMRVSFAELPRRSLMHGLPWKGKLFRLGDSK